MYAFVFSGWRQEPAPLCHARKWFTLHFRSRRTFTGCFEWTTAFAFKVHYSRQRFWIYRKIYGAKIWRSMIKKLCIKSFLYHIFYESSAEFGSTTMFLKHCIHLSPLRLPPTRFITMSCKFVMSSLVYWIITAFIVIKWEWKC